MNFENVKIIAQQKKGDVELDELLEEFVSVLEEQSDELEDIVRDVNWVPGFIVSFVFRQVEDRLVDWVVQKLYEVLKKV